MRVRISFPGSFLSFLVLLGMVIRSFSVQCSEMLSCLGENSNDPLFVFWSRYEKRYVHIESTPLVPCVVVIVVDI